MNHDRAHGGGLPILAAWGLGIIEGLVGILCVIWLLFWPPLLEVCYSGIEPRMDRKADAIAVVRWLHGNSSPAVLNASLQHGKLSRKELNHYVDVRTWVRRLPLGLAGLGLGAAMLISVYRPHMRMLAAAQTRGICFLVILTVGCVLLAAWDWQVLFAWLHYPFFGASSWRFSNAAYSLQLFPTQFWQWMAIASIFAPLLSMALVWAALTRRCRRIPTQGMNITLRSRKDKSKRTRANSRISADVSAASGR